MEMIDLKNVFIQIKGENNSTTRKLHKATKFKFQLVEIFYHRNNEQDNKHNCTSAEKYQH